ncbi:Valine--pyruvate aminotransferase [Yamadazyma tenuis]|uniref:PLP-dependent transferase n=1 Tax=Candida tenuis (strain ATCC 10573 / BCRC 21748 / CBS 615 / JCM 9827 / NBRC 10315 / NRRL Y-1498 / VKM Y-70) TaxID=590646 RepID=G3B7W7_CANTC|nr:PLP-dependent transferase [Yamadazyma tenuis ATCC 10573]XP_006688778.1 uncharacterized protein CANTEDRAFT_115132 [Yamadazyma tenuis ATCC 10573]EGV62607.1 PLP-dependent transferase [Yamadazyma tenuis ATCC 10573]EGV62608.1 hypothetical protein CANTEDRAFT_115132 [Yamadazyma tenuis ATCC 10573]WEJ92901.1 Valine--pyruvate aminotransferase [Yamadazyma tenuis]
MSNRVINFFKGYASNSLHPRKELEAAFSKVLLETDFDKYDTDPDNQHPLNYGTDPGNFDIRQQLSKFMARKFNVPEADPDCFNLTNGASFGIGMALKMATNLEYTKKVFVVSPCYFLINHSFVDAGFSGRIASINETPGAEYEIDIEALEMQLQNIDKENGEDKTGGIFPDPLGRDDNRVYRSVIYIVPTYSNPGGLTYSLKTRLKMIELARRHNMLIICDDVYDLLNYTDDSPLPRLVHLDRETCTDGWGHVVSNASTSKLISPGLRFGWHETATPKLAFQFSQEGNTKSGGTPSQLNSYVIHELLITGTIDDIINNFISHYRERSKVLKDSIKKYLPPSTKFYGGDGGYFIWVTLDPKYNLVKVVSTLAKEHNIILASGTNFEVAENHRGLGDSVRLCFSFLTPPEIEYGIKTFGSLLKEDETN